MHHLGTLHFITSLRITSATVGPAQDRATSPARFADTITAYTVSKHPESNQPVPIACQLKSLLAPNVAANDQNLLEYCESLQLNTSITRMVADWF